MKIKVQDREGNVLEVYPVDARELTASGEYTYVDLETGTTNEPALLTEDPEATTKKKKKGQ
jgi:hypothetical protein